MLDRVETCPFQAKLLINPDNGVEIDDSVALFETQVKALDDRRNLSDARITALAKSIFASAKKSDDGSPTYVRKSDLETMIKARMLEGSPYSRTASDEVKSDIDRVLKRICVSTFGTGARLAATEEIGAYDNTGKHTFIGPVIYS